MFSRMVKSPTMPSVLRFSGQKANPLRIAARVPRTSVFLPRTSTSPRSIRSTPKMSRAVSLRPEPSSPERPSTSPRRISRFTSGIEAEPAPRSSTSTSPIRSSPPFTAALPSSSAYSLPIILPTSWTRGSSAVA